MLPTPIVSGKDLISLGAKPGPAFKFALDRTFDRQLDSDDNKEKLMKAALSFIKCWEQQNDQRG
jgi:hypothetical protein